MNTFNVHGLNFLGILAGIAIWAILFTIILGVLRRSSLFGGKADWIIAACVAALSLIGIFEFFTPSQMADTRQARDRTFMVVLLPYAAMGIAMLATLLLSFLLKMLRKRPEENSECDRCDTSRRIAKTD